MNRSGILAAALGITVAVMLILFIALWQGGQTDDKKRACAARGGFVVTEGSGGTTLCVDRDRKIIATWDQL